MQPQAIRTGLDVYGENARKIVPIDSPTFGRVMAVCVGAMMVGSILTTVKEGEYVARGQEFGYFAFGAFKTRGMEPFLIGNSRRIDGCPAFRKGCS